MCGDHTACGVACMGGVTWHGGSTWWGADMVWEGIAWYGRGSHSRRAGSGWGSDSGGGPIWPAVPWLCHACPPPASGLPWVPPPQSPSPQSPSPMWRPGDLAVALVGCPVPQPYPALHPPVPTVLLQCSLGPSSWGNNAAHGARSWHPPLPQPLHPQPCSPCPPSHTPCAC